MSRAAAGVWIAPLVPLGAGAAVMIAAGAPAGRSGVHLVAGALGVLVWFAVRALAPRFPGGVGARLTAALALVVVATMTATLGSDGIEGVRRWLRVGPLLLHPSALFCPVLLALATRWIRMYPVPTLLVLLAAQAIHVAQPDAGQATAFGAATAVLVLGRLSPSGVGPGAAVIALLAASIGASWIRSDPLAPAPFVEDIVGRAFELGALPGVLALGSLLPLFIAPFLARPAEAGASEGGVGLTRAAGWVAPLRRMVLSDGLVLAVYLVGSALVVLAGEFPVPVLGFGASPVLGAFLGLAALRGAPPVRAEGA